MIRPYSDIHRCVEEFWKRDTMLGHALKCIMDLIFPTRAICMGCNSKAGCEVDWLCSDCIKSLSLLRLDLSLPGAIPLIRRRFHTFKYSGPAANMVKHLKYYGVCSLAKPMAEMMLASINGFKLSPDMLVPVPMPFIRRRKRGFNQAELLSRELSKLMGIPSENVLKRSKLFSKRQVKLSAASRRKNLKDAFVSTVRLDGRSVLLIDDVYTTGATANNCAKALMAAGCKCVYLLTFAIA